VVLLLLEEANEGRFDELLLLGVAVPAEVGVFARGAT
jgi:hypothetical protein